MRKLKLQVQISLDGYIADGDGRTDWMVWNWGANWGWDAPLRKRHNALTASVDCILLSRKMAEEGFIGHWAKVAGNPKDPQREFAGEIAAARKVVFSKTLGESRWENTVLARGDLAAEVRALKRRKGRDILAYGGASFVSSLIQARLVDEYHLFVNPTALGSGMPIFSAAGSKLDLTLVKAKAYACGITVLQYAGKT